MVFSPTFPFQTKATFFALVLFLFSFSAQAQENIAFNMKKAQETFARLESENNFKDNLSHADMNILPMGIKQTISNMSITLAVNSAEFFPEYTELGIFLRLEVPNREQPLMFGAQNIKLSHEGDIIGDARLTLMSDIEIPISGDNVLMRLKGGYNKTTGEAANLTYVTIDCKGFKQLGITAEVELPRNLCQPVGLDGKVKEGEQVVGRFKTEVDNWTDIVARVSLPSFEIKGLTGFIWNIQNAVFDFSDLKNDPLLTFPQEYNQYLIPGNETLWKGIYVKELSLTLPTQFSKENKQRVSFSATNMIIDDKGITGVFGVNAPLLSINEGNASGWAFSVDAFNLKLLTNRLEEATFKGELRLPISEKTRLGYTGTIAANDTYVMQVQSIDTLSFDLFQAKAEIDPNSYVEFKVIKGQFRPEAMLHGRMGVEVSLPSEKERGNSLTKIQGIEFRSLHLKTESPYFTAQYFGYKGDAKLGNFPVSIKELALISRGEDIALSIEVDVNLMKDNFKGGTRIEIVGSMESNRLHQWKYKKIDISQIKLNATIAEMLVLNGSLDIMNADPVYGDGFAGSISVEFKKDKGPLKGLKVETRGMFGRKDFDYWFVDGIANIPGIGIPIGPSINLTGFGGGVTYRMRPQGTDGRTQGQVLTATSMSYVPDANYSLGIKAATTYNIGSNDIAHGEACFELAFNNNGGLNYAGFYGYAQFVAQISALDTLGNAIGEKYKNIVDKEAQIGSKLPGGTLKALEQTKQYNAKEAGKLYTEDNKLGKANFTAAVGIQFDFTKSAFHANAELYVNAAGGLVTGIGPNNSAGEVVLHIDPDNWYIYMGTPSRRIGLKMGIGKLGSIETGSYLMAGTNIHEAPELPSQVASILKEDPAKLNNYMKNLNLISSGKGLAFGSNLSINTGDLTFLILYANYSAGLGFDAMLKKFDTNPCKAGSGSVGMDGWFATGQAYAYMHGELGVKINLWFMKAKVPIITADFATLLQAQLPNPSSFKGYIAVDTKVLGLIKVNCRFKLEIGDECDIVNPGGSPLATTIINDISPIDKSKDISVFTAPQVTFNMPIGESFDAEDDQGKKRYKLRLGKFTLNSDEPIVGEWKLNKENNAASFYAHKVLPSQNDVTATVEVYFDELRGGRWEPVMTGGKEAKEIRTITFRTDKAPKEIPLHNVVYSYPVVGQKYYLKDESRKGYIQLQFDQDYLFSPEMQHKIKMETSNGESQLVDFNYNTTRKRIEYTFPDIQRESGYKISILSMNTDLGDESGKTEETTLLNNAEDGNISVESRQAADKKRGDIGKVVLAYDFSTSKHNTFKEKVDAIVKGNAIIEKITLDMWMFGYKIKQAEPFDLAELLGTQQTENKPLISPTAMLDDVYYQEDIFPKIYKDYPISSTIRLKNRDESILGVPPVKALPLVNSYLNAIESGNFRSSALKDFPYLYNLPQIYKSDLMDLQSQVLPFYMSNTSHPAYKRLVGRFPYIRSGMYRIKLQYILPGGIEGTSTVFEYKNIM